MARQSRALITSPAARAPASGREEGRCSGFRRLLGEVAPCLAIPESYESYGPRKRTPLKWTRCVGLSAHQTSVSQLMSWRYSPKARFVRNAVT
jgi:hypothetical protein